MWCAILDWAIRSSGEKRVEIGWKDYKERKKDYSSQPIPQPHYIINMWQMTPILKLAVPSETIKYTQIRPISTSVTQNGVKWGGEVWWSQQSLQSGGDSAVTWSNYHNIIQLCRCFITVLWRATYTSVSPTWEKSTEKTCVRQSESDQRQTPSSVVSIIQQLLPGSDRSLWVSSVEMHL